MTLTQLGAFVLVARLGSVRAAAGALGVSEPAVSQALAALRRHLGDDLIVREGNTMRLTSGGQRLISIASQMVNLGAEAEAAIRHAQGAPELLRIVADPAIAEFVATGLADAFTMRAKDVETTVGVASQGEMAVLLQERLADVALGPAVSGDGVESTPVMRCQQVVVASPGVASHCDRDPRRLHWLVGPTGSDPGSTTGELLARLAVPDEQIRVFPSLSAAWAAAAAGAGVAPALVHLVQEEIDRRSLRLVALPTLPAEVRWHVSTLAVDRRPRAAGRFRQFLSTAVAMRLMHTPGRGVVPSRFRPPVYVTIWS